ncbi:MAG: GDP-mannose 4,6-dehydratase [Deltaproteobacteria bacterium]|nr:GDP-mannose 4,6-dehydratase [Deltaproteobacteria bacterium]
MKFLVTGGAGFIGSHVCEYLLEHQHTVFALDDLSTGSAQNIQDLKKSNQFHFFYDSILNESILSNLIDQCDIILHLAAVVGVQKVISSPVETIERNVKGTEFVLKYANIKKKKVLITSTSEVYGKGNHDRFSETDDLTIGPTFIGRWGYACSKAIDEFLGFAYYKEYKLPVIIVRFFNVIGPRQVGHYGMVVPRFIDQALVDQPLTVFGNGLQTRCFLYVKDAVEAVYKLALSEASVGNVFNLGNPHAISISDLAKKIISLTNSKSDIRFIPYHQCYGSDFEDMMKRVPNIEKINHHIGFLPKTNLEDMLKEMIRFKTSARESSKITPPHFQIQSL